MKPAPAVCWAKVRKPRCGSYIGCRSIPFQHLCLLLHGEYAHPFIRVVALSVGRSEDTLPEVKKSPDSPYGSVAHTSHGNGGKRTHSAPRQTEVLALHSTPNRYIRAAETSRPHVLTTAHHTTSAADCHLTQPKRVRLTSPSIPTRNAPSVFHVISFRHSFSQMTQKNLHPKDVSSCICFLI